MAILTKGNTYSSGQSVTAANLNALVDSATFKTGNGEAVDGTTLQVHASGYLMVKDGGISATKLAAGAVDSAIGTGGITDAQLASDAVTTAKIADNAITSAKISDTDTQFLVDDTSAQKKVVINEAGADVDFRVEGDTDTNLLVCDATADKVGIGAVPSGSYKLEVAGDISAYGSGNKKVISHSTDGVAYLEMYSGGQAANKKLGRLVPFDGKMQLAWVDDDGTAGVVVQLDQATGGFEPNADNAQPLGSASKRWSVVYSVTSAINTSDRNLKEEIEELSDTELRVAQTCKGLVRRFKFKGGTRKHIGLIAQDVRDAFTAEGLDAHEYGLFCSDTWTDEGTGEEVTQLGIRYEELLAFIISAL